MGGSGSGNWYRSGGKSLAEVQAFIDVAYMKQQGYLQPGRIWRLSWKWGEKEAGKISGVTTEGSLTLLYKYRRNGEEWETVEQPVRLTFTPCHYGGQRPWFICPGVVSGRRCGRRVGKLFAGGRYFLCRHCYDLAYQSQREDLPYRLQLRADSIKRRLLARCTPEQRLYVKPDDTPPRPKGMHLETYRELKMQIQMLELQALQTLVFGLDSRGMYPRSSGKRRDSG